MRARVLQLTAVSASLMYHMTRCSDRTGILKVFCPTKPSAGDASRHRAPSLRDRPHGIRPERGKAFGLSSIHDSSDSVLAHA